MIVLRISLSEILSGQIPNPLGGDPDAPYILNLNRFRERENVLKIEKMSKYAPIIQAYEDDYMRFYVMDMGFQESSNFIDLQSIWNTDIEKGLFNYFQSYELIDKQTTYELGTRPMTPEEFNSFDLKEIEDKNLETAKVETNVYTLVYQSNQKRVINIWKYFVARVEEWANIKTEQFAKYTFDVDIE